MKKSVIIFSGLGFVLLAVLATGALGPRQEATAPKEEQEMGAAETEQARIAEEKAFYGVGRPVYSWVGTVNSVSGNVIYFVVPDSSNPYEQIPTRREAVVGEQTKIFITTLKDEAVYAQELAVWETAVAAIDVSQLSPGDRPLAAPPSRYAQREATISEIREGESISAHTPGEDTRFTVRFTPTRIVVGR